MPANRKRLAITASPDRWQLLGELLEEQRRVGLGYRFRTDFARARLPLTPDGKPNTRRVDDLESNRRPNHWPAGTLKEMAAAYGVTYESLLAVLRGESDKLEPADIPAARPLPAPPESALVREDAARSWAAAIWERLLDLADEGIRDPSGAQLGLSPADAGIWDGSAGAMSRADRVWLVADIQRGRAARAAASHGSATSA